MTNPFADKTMDDFVEHPTRPGYYLLKGTPMAQALEARSAPTDAARRETAPVQARLPRHWPGAIPTTLPASTTEEELRAWIRKVALPRGWLHFHVRDSRQSAGEGFPDDFLTNGTDILMWELKMHGKKPTQAQQQWLSHLTHTGKVECGVKYPQDWPEIVARLTQGGGAHGR